MTKQKNFDTNLDKFYNFLVALLGNYRNLIAVLKEELQLILSGNILLLGENLKSQQVLLIQTKDFDKQVSAHSCSLNIHANNLTEMTLQLPVEHQPRFFRLLDDFDIVLKETTFYKEKCRVLLQSKLYTIDKALSKLEVQRDTTTYDKNASEIQGGLLPKSFEKKV